MKLHIQLCGDFSWELYESVGGYCVDDDDDDDDDKVFMMMNMMIAMVIA